MLPILDNSTTKQLHLHQILQKSGKPKDKPKVKKITDTFRSSRLDVLCKKTFLKSFHKIYRKTPALDSLFHKVGT